MKKTVLLICTLLILLVPNSFAGRSAMTPSIYSNSGGANLTGYFNNIINFTGVLTNTKVCTYNGITGKIDCNSDPSTYDDTNLWTNASLQQAQINALWGENTTIWNTLYELNQNDTAIINFNNEIYGNVTALQGENTTIWNTLYETYTNLTSITSYNDSAVVNALQAENITIWNTLYELNQNDTSDTNRDNSSIEARAPLAGATFTGAVIGTTARFPELNATNITTNHLNVEDIKFVNSTFLGLWSNSTVMIIGNITGLI
jgi:hypothetical protein